MSRVIDLSSDYVLDFFGQGEILVGHDRLIDCICSLCLMAGPPPCALSSGQSNLGFLKCILPFKLSQFDSSSTMIIIGEEGTGRAQKKVPSITA